MNYNRRDYDLDEIMLITIKAFQIMFWFWDDWADYWPTYLSAMALRDHLERKIAAR